jgi:hypothetical protein
MTRKTESELKTIKELYKCHFTAKETAGMMNFSYAVISNIFRGFIVAKIHKYDRFGLASHYNIDYCQIVGKPPLLEYETTVPPGLNKHRIWEGESYDAK